MTWTRPQRRWIYGSMLAMVWAIVMVVLWMPTGESWWVVSRSNLPRGCWARHFGAVRYLTIREYDVTINGVPGPNYAEVWFWRPEALAASAAITGFGAAVCIIAARRLVHRHRLVDRCDQCGYDLTGIDGRRCPECGAPT